MSSAPPDPRPDASDAAPVGETPEAPAPRRGRVRRAQVLPALGALGIIAVLALGPAADHAASQLPLPASRLPLASTAPRLELPQEELEAQTRIRDVPVGLPEGTRIRSVGDVRPYAVEALGPSRAERLLVLLSSATDQSAPDPLEPTTWDYPYRFPAVDAVLHGVPQEKLARRGAGLGAALILLTADPDLPFELTLASARVAYAVLDRARSTGGCDPQLNLLALVASDPEFGDDVVQTELREAETFCPKDPTGGWLTVQRALATGIGEDVDVTEAAESLVSRLNEATAAATDLVRRFPRDPGVLSTLGDTYLATGQQLVVSQPFTARRAFQDAATAFEHLGRHGESVAAQLGAARAHLGLGRPEPAAQLAVRAADASTRPGRALQVAVSAEERAHRFDRATALARRLATLGRSGFPVRTRIIPLAVPLSWGFDSMSPLTVLLLGGGEGGGGVVADEGFIPTYRGAEDLTDTGEYCPEWVWRRDALLAGDAAGARSGWPREFRPTDPTMGYCPDGARLKGQIDAQLAGRFSPDLDEPKDPEDLEEPEYVEDVEDVEAADRLFDDRQNLLRWAGDLGAARQVTLAWTRQLGVDAALAYHRLGEIDYLLRDYDAAAAAFAQSAVRWPVRAWQNDLAVDQALLGQGAALLRADRGDEAVAILRPLVLDGARGSGYQWDQGGGFEQDFATISYYAATLLGDHELAVGNDRAASEHFGAALYWSHTLEGVVHLDALRNSAAIAALGTGDVAGAVALSRDAVSGDPHSPVYLMTAAEVAYRDGDVPSAIRQNRAALETDPSDYPAANNLGVLLASQGHLTPAALVLRSAVEARPTYALGWFNLGVVEGRRGPTRMLASQGALARAVALDDSFADRPPRPAMDTATYRTSLDVSKPIPAGWSFAESQRRAPAVTVGLLAVVLAGVGLARLRGPSSDSGAGEWLGSLDGRVRRLRGIQRIRRPVWAVVATVGAFLLAFWREPVWPWTGIAYAVGLVALVGAGMVARAVVARRGAGDLEHGTWPPGVVVGLVSGAFGSPIAPLPVVKRPAEDTRVAMAAPLTLAALALLLLIESAWLHTPVTTSLGVAALIMAGSLLLPVKPLDGARAGRAGVIGAAGLVGAVLLLGLGLV